MNTKANISDNTNKLAELAKICNKELERNRKFILESQSIIDKIKLAKMETNYFVECSFDYLITSTPHIYSLAQHQSEDHSKLAIIDFESARARLQRTTKHQNGRLKQYR